MTSKKSFWAKTANINRQKSWMWIISAIGMLTIYPSTLIMYLNRIKTWYPADTPAHKRIYASQMYEAVCDALGYRHSVIFFVLGIVFGLGIFGYLNNRSKVDTFMSIPVKAKTMFINDYISGILICVVPYLLSLVISVLTAVAWGYMSVLAFSECLLTVLINVAVFLIYYNITIICICLTGNLFVAFGGIMVISFGPGLIADTMDSLKYFFFKTANGWFDYQSATLVPGLYTDIYSYRIKGLNDFGKEVKFILPDMLFWIAVAAITMIIVCLCYLKRPAEAMHKAVYSKKLRMILKLIIAPAAGLIISIPVFQASAENKWMMITAAIVVTVFAGMALEAIYAFDIKGALRSLLTTFIGTLITICVLAVYFFDLTGYDRYVPRASQIKSFALETNPFDYSEFFEIGGPSSQYYDPSTPNINWVDSPRYKRDHMFLTQKDAIAELARISVDNDLITRRDFDENITTLSVFYRLGGGLNASRSICVDRSDPHSMELLDNITGSEEFLNSLFGACTQGDELDKIGASVQYTNGVGYEYADMTPSQIIDIWRDDAQTFNYSKGYNEYPCGVIVLGFSGMSYRLPVYDDFAHTIQSLKHDGSFLENELSADDIESIVITNYHNELYENGGEYFGDPSVTVTIDDPEEIKEILKNTTPVGLSHVWNKTGEKDSYSISVFFESSYEYARKGEFINFVFTDSVPEWVKEKTAM